VKQPILWSIDTMALCVVVAVIAAVPLACAATAPDLLSNGFHHPPQAARPQVWWHWMSGNVTAEGARLDLAWMHRVGIGGVHAFAGGQMEPTVVAKPVPFMSDAWKSIYRSAVGQANGYGMDVTIAGSPGWSQSGGPWVQPAQGMKKYVWSTTEVVGGQASPIVLSAPPTATGPFGAVEKTSDIGNTVGHVIASGNGPVVAFPSPDAAAPAASSHGSMRGDLPGLAHLSADLSRQVSLPIAVSGDTWIQVGYTQPVDMQTLVLAVSPFPAIDILASDDGITFRDVRQVPQDDAEQPAQQQTIQFARTHARIFRVRFLAHKPWRVLGGVDWPIKEPKALSIRRLDFLPTARIDHFEAKSGFQSVVDPATLARAGNIPGIDPDKVIDLTSRMKPDGTLDWTPPPGRWTILRFGWSLTGALNGPAEASATGLEVDKLDPAAVSDYVRQLFDLYSGQAGIRTGATGITGLLCDSWEAGVANWTPGLLREFRRRRKYDLTPWLPTLAGYTVGDGARSDAALFDFRQTLKDMVVDNYYQLLARATHQRGMAFYTEVQGDTPRAISDGMTAKARADIPTGEYWYRPFAAVEGQPSLVADLQESASAAHLYGHRLVAAESLTVAAETDMWGFSPAMLKVVADRIFAYGVNRILIHESHLQPFVDRKPGLTLGSFGMTFNRNETWAEQAGPFVDYLARTSFLLQQGHYVADVAYFYGEEENLTQRFELHPNHDVPDGYHFDYINPEALLTMLAVRDGRIVTPGGMSYRVLYLPGYVNRVTLPLLKRIQVLVNEGAVLVARKPSGGLGLQSADSDVMKLADAIWRSGGTTAVGKGRVYADGNLDAALQAEGIAPDIDAGASNSRLLSLHRRTDDADLYFLSNESGQPLASPVTFRVQGKRAQWWSSDDGSIRPLSFVQHDGSTTVDITLPAQSAGFVVFRTPTTQASYRTTPLSTLATWPVPPHWLLSFPATFSHGTTQRLDGLLDWSRSSDSDIRYFSGTAVYRQTIKLPRSVRAPGTRLLLNLGDVREVATVLVNGQKVGTAWHAPYQLDVSHVLRPGNNDIELRVTNLWVNRLVGDKQPGAVAKAYAPNSSYTANVPLRPSGLLGPVDVVQVTGGEGEQGR
jgi:(4-O-methyl)-D-glucuronate---lignin esterase